MQGESNVQDETKEQMTLGSAIDRILAALSPLDDMSRQTAIKAVCEQLRITLPGVSQQGPASTSVGATVRPPLDADARSTTPADIKSFSHTKSPATAIEQTALVAFYVSELAPQGERRNWINKEDLMKYFRQAGFPLPKRPEMTLVHAKNAGYLDRLGPGQYRLNAVGYNLIAHNLPRDTPASSRKAGPRRSCKSGQVTRRRRAAK
jgi:hypothetical protein